MCSPACRIQASAVLYADWMTKLALWLSIYIQLSILENKTQCQNCFWYLLFPAFGSKSGGRCIVSMSNDLFSPLLWWSKIFYGHKPPWFLGVTSTIPPISAPACPVVRWWVFTLELWGYSFHLQMALPKEVCSHGDVVLRRVFGPLALQRFGDLCGPKLQWTRILMVDQCREILGSYLAVRI